MGDLSEKYRSLRSRLASIQHPILWILVIGIAIRLLASTLSVVYDADYWALVIRNIEAGEGLYGVEGYYYTPVWGYILGLISAFQSIFLDLGCDVVRVVELLFSEAVPFVYFSATVPSVAFTFTVNLPLIISDVILAFGVRYLVKDATGDDHKADLAFAMVFLCPLLIGITCITGMPDTFAATFLVLTVILLKRERYLVAGMMFSLAVLTKFFPVFVIFPLIAYVILKASNRKAAVLNLSYAVIGAVGMTLIIFIPQILDGTLEQCFQFLTDRTGSSVESNLFDIIAGKARIIMYVAVIIASILCAVHMYRSGKDRSDHNMMRFCFLLLTMCMLYPPAPQYMISMLPFLVYWAVVEDGKCALSWKIISFASIFFITTSNALLLLPLAAWTNLISVDTVAGLLQWFSAGGGFTPGLVWMVFGGVMTYIGIVSIFLIMFRDRMPFKRRGIVGQDSD